MHTNRYIAQTANNALTLNRYQFIALTCLVGRHSGRMSGSEFVYNIICTAETLAADFFSTYTYVFRLNNKFSVEVHKILLSFLCCNVFSFRLNLSYF